LHNLCHSIIALHSTMYYNNTMKTANLKSNYLVQIKKGTLEFCVLALLTDQPCYGYDIVTLLTEKGISASQGTIYPLLGRLEREGKLDAHWKQEGAAKPRKYYTVTEEGRRALSHFKESWLSYSAAVNRILWRG